MLVNQSLPPSNKLKMSKKVCLGSPTVGWLAGWVTGWLAGRLGTMIIQLSSAQLRLGLGLSLAILKLACIALRLKVEFWLGGMGWVGGDGRWCKPIIM